MAEPTTFPEEHVVEPQVYQRVSGFALAGIIVASTFTLIMLVAAVWSLIEKTPLLLPVGVQMIPAVSGVLCGMGLWLISRSEGTLAGRKMALTGLLLSVFVGLGYTAYYSAAYFVVRQKAEKFNEEWFQKVENGKFWHAFIDTLEPEIRRNLNPDNTENMKARFNLRQTRSQTMEEKGRFDMFMEHPMIRFLRQGGPTVQITPLGTRDLDYKDGAYRVERTWRVTTQEGTVEMTIPVIGRNSPKREFEGRQWQIVWAEVSVAKAKETSQLANNVSQLRKPAQAFLVDWGKKLVEGDLEGAFLDTREVAERGKIQAEYRARMAAAGLAMGTLPGAAVLAGVAVLEPETSRQAFLPEYRATFTQGDRNGFLESKDLQGDDPTWRTIGLYAARSMFGKPMEGVPVFQRLAAENTSALHVWKLERDRLVMPIDGKLGFFFGNVPRVLLSVTFILETDPGDPDPARKPSWRVARVELQQASDPARGMLGGGPPPGVSRAGGPPPGAPMKK
jgi:hypothetical protein